MWEDLNVSEDAARVTGFDYKSYVKQAEDPAIVYKEFIDLINQDDVIIIGQNLLGYDIYILGVIARQLGLKIDYSFVNRILILKLLLRHLLKVIKLPTTMILRLGKLSG